MSLVIITASAPLALSLVARFDQPLVVCGQPLWQSATENLAGIAHHDAENPVGNGRRREIDWHGKLPLHQSG